jgi:long-chain acyl-CoA synthetase
MLRPWLRHYAPHVPAEIDFGHLQCIFDLVSQAFTKYQRQPAASCMGTTITYGELEMAVNRFAGFLQGTLKLRKGERIAIMLPNTLQFLIAELAALKVGVICVNTNPLYTPREMLHQFNDSGVRTIVIVDMFAKKLEEILPQTEIENVIMTSIGDQFPLWKGLIFKQVMNFKKLVPKHSIKAWSFKKALKAGGRESLDPVSITLDDVALLQYTGGTTGVAKGAMLSHRNILANMLQIQAVTKPALQRGEEVVLTALPLYHIFALSVNFLSFLADGHHMILVPNPMPIENTVQIFRQFKITVVTGVNTLFNALNNSKSFRERAPKHLKVAIAGGMALQESVNRQFQSITGTPITEGFGLTEASPVTHVNPLGVGNPPGSIGLPLPSTLARIVRDDGQDCPPGEVGELIIKGPQVMLGYWLRDDESSKVLRDGWLWTGDMARMDESGFFFIVDRKKDMILVSGFNVYPNEVEEVIAGHPKVLEVAVIGVPDKSSGEAVKAVIVPKDKTLSKDELRTYCKERLTGYKCPRQYEFRDSLPKSNVGKILRKELRDTPPVKP